uniref:Uncharacterized protein n=1 Tax=Triticum urartu TaxID=4572 RepID=A0A8R7TVD0_TRIUA
MEGKGEYDQTQRNTSRWWLYEFTCMFKKGFQDLFMDVANQKFSLKRIGVYLL